MKERFKEYLTFNKGERIGITILLTVLIIIAFLPRIFRNTIDYRNDDYESFNIEVHNFLRESDSVSTVSVNKEPGNISRLKPKPTYNPRSFNPNTASLEEFCEMGFTARQASTIINYRKSGGLFYVKEDFKKLYIVDDYVYSVFSPYIELPAEVKKEKLAVQKYESKEVSRLIELNSADSMALISVKGIGPVFASRILNYRDKTGGFANVNQLLEVYGIDSLKFSGISGQVSADSSLIRRIDINDITLEQLRKHPYFNYYLAKAVIDKRIQKGRLSGEEDLKEVFRNKEVLFKKIRPYLSFGR